MSIYAPYHLGDITEYRTSTDDRIESLGVAIYADGDEMGSTNGGLQLDAIYPVPGGVPALTQVRIIETRTAGTLQKPALRLWYFSADYTGAAQNAPMTFPADGSTVIGYVDIAGGDWVELNASTAVVRKTLHAGPLLLQLAPNTRAAYMRVQSKGTPTFDASAQLRFIQTWE